MNHDLLIEIYRAKLEELAKPSALEELLLSRKPVGEIVTKSYPSKPEPAE